VAAPLGAFLAAHAGGAPPARACIGIAGTIVGRAARVAGVNMPWSVDADALERACGLPRVDLVNDFYAAARGVELMGPGDLHAIPPSDPAGSLEALPGQPRAILGAGTGLGQALIVPVDPGGWKVVPSEGGHRDFAARTALEDRLLAWLRASYGHVSTERVLSGPGLVNIYRFLVEVEGMPACAEVDAATGAGQGPEITERGLASAHPTCARALETFVDVYGAEAGNVALTVLATGGVYLAGGIAPRVLTRAETAARFRRAFDDKGRFRDLLDSIPVYVITNPDLALLGAACEAALRP
jgi:glucokinase